MIPVVIHIALISFLPRNTITKWLASPMQHVAILSIAYYSITQRVLIFVSFFTHMFNASLVI